MSGEAILTISAAVVLLVQILKWAGIDGKLAPLSVLVASLAGVVFWGWSQNAFSREAAFQFFAGWVSVSASAAGVFGFVREGASAVTAMRKPDSTDPTQWPDD